MIAPPASIGGDSGGGRRSHYSDMAGHELDACIEVWNRIKKKKILVKGKTCHINSLQEPHVVPFKRDL